MARLIVGVDPGTTFAFAAFDLNGNLVRVFSERDIGRDRIVEEISRWGDVSIIATDMAEAPESVVKIAAYFNSRLYTPPRDLRYEEKRELACEWEGRYSNLHEMDAIASAVKAYRSFENKLRLIERVARENNAAGEIEEIKHLVLNGCSVKNALLLLEKKPVVAYKPVRIGSGREGRREDEYYRKLRNLVIANTELRKRVEELMRENDVLRRELDRVKRGVWEGVMMSREIRRREREIARLKKTIQEIKRGYSPQNGGKPQGHVLKGLSSKIIEEIVREYKEKRRVKKA